MGTEEGGNKSESEIKKGLILENLGRLQSKIKLLQHELRLEKEKNSQPPKNLCWWDAKPCGRYTQILGMQETGIRCRDCSRVDDDSLALLLEEVNPGCLQGPLDEAKEEAEEKIEKAKGDQEETLQEIHEEILNVMADANAEPVDPP